MKSRILKNKIKHIHHKINRYKQPLLDHLQNYEQTIDIVITEIFLKAKIVLIDRENLVASLPKEIGERWPWQNCFIRGHGNHELRSSVVFGGRWLRVERSFAFEGV